MRPDVLVVGGGPVGCTVAQQAAEAGLRVLVVERRTHLGGNCHDGLFRGFRVPTYGPHYFRTDSDELLAYLSRFTSWLPARYVVQAKLESGELVPMPVNRKTLEVLYGVELATPADAEALLVTMREPHPSPVDAEQYALDRVGRHIYSQLLVGYTLKQWGRHPSQLLPWLFGRLPVRTSLEDSYVSSKHQCMPAPGYEELFHKMVGHPKITVRLGTSFADVRGVEKPRVATVYTGPLDEYFGRRLGALPWRSLRFELQHFRRPWYQSSVQVNYPSLDVAYTRIMEPKHITGQQSDQTVIIREYPQAGGDPYYPIPEAGAQLLAQRYMGLANIERRRRRVYFAGRLAEYRYLNMDEAFLRGLQVAREILK